VAIPTGLGKTFIARNNHAELVKMDGLMLKIVFVAPRNHSSTNK